MEPQNPHDDSLARRIENGEYFDEAREWYHLLYTRPISQRIFFIIVACFAGLFMVVAVTSVLNLLPIVPRVPFAIYTQSMDENIPSMQRFKGAGESADPAIMRFYLTSYIQRKEGYSANKLTANRAFVMQHSLPEVGNAYLRGIDQANAQSPLRLYGQTRSLAVEIHQVQFLKQPAESAAAQQAQIDFSTIVMTNESQQKTDWTALVSYEYTNLVIRNTFDAALGDYKLDFDEPAFKVLSYEKRERLGGVK